jgi:hypothetical protein
MARKTQQENKPQTRDEYIQHKIDQRVETETSLFSKQPTSEQIKQWEWEAGEDYDAEQQMSTEIARNEEAREPVPYVESYEDAADLFTDQGGLVTIDDYLKLDDKELLLGKPFIVLQWWFSEGDMGTYATMKVITKDPVRGVADDERRKFTVVDGSTGICAQLQEISKRTGKHGGLQVRDGLRVSRYTWQGAPAATFYLT